jgi:hypothetical protein
MLIQLAELLTFLRCSVDGHCVTIYTRSFSPDFLLFFRVSRLFLSEVHQRNYHSLLRLIFFEREILIAETGCDVRDGR